jgi:hypothetical protein
MTQPHFLSSPIERHIPSTSMPLQTIDAGEQYLQLL